MRARDRDRAYQPRRPRETVDTDPMPTVPRRKREQIGPLGPVPRMLIGYDPERTRTLRFFDEDGRRIT